MPRSRQKKLSSAKVAADGRVRKRVKRGQTKSTRKKITTLAGSVIIRGSGPVLNKNPRKPVRFAILGKSFDPASTTVTAVEDAQYEWGHRIQRITPTFIILELTFVRDKNPHFDDSGEINVTVTNDTTTPGTTLIVPVVYDNF